MYRQILKEYRSKLIDIDKILKITIYIKHSKVDLLI